MEKRMVSVRKVLWYMGLLLCLFQTSCTTMTRTLRSAVDNVYEVRLTEGNYVLKVNYKNGDVTGNPNFGNRQNERSVYPIQGYLCIQEQDGTTIEKFEIKKLILLGPVGNPSWTLVFFEVNDSGVVRFCFDGELADFVKGRKLTVNNMWPK